MLKALQERHGGGAKHGVCPYEFEQRKEAVLTYSKLTKTAIALITPHSTACNNGHLDQHILLLKQNIFIFLNKQTKFCSWRQHLISPVKTGLRKNLTDLRRNMVWRNINSFCPAVCPCVCGRPRRLGIQGIVSFLIWKAYLCTMEWEAC